MLGGISWAFVVLSCSLVVTNAGIFRRSHPQEKTCGYESCPKSHPDKLNVHLVAHTHDDVGWLKTVDQYFYGARNDVQKAGVQYILDTVVEALRKDSERRFIYVETAFLWKWWLRQDEKVKEDFRKFVNEGRLEIIGGAWSMNDEATTHYHSIVDQFTWGLRRLNDTFGQCARPKIGWQIDPFGHSREQASLFAQFGFDGLFFGRLDWQDKVQRMKDKTAEIIWKGSSSLGKDAELFTVALFNAYSPPPGFCFDILCQDQPLIDDPESPDYNIDTKIKEFYDYVINQAKHYKTNSIILTMGGDFTYQLAEQYFINLDRLIRYTTQLYGKEINVFYSTPSCYIKALNEAQKTWVTKTDDFFPYSSDPHAFWTGYFTSRPTLKYFERLGNNFLQIIKQLSVLSNAGDSEDLQYFREVMGVMQHHDAVTGTEKQHVADDYARMLNNAFIRGEKIVKNSISRLSAENPSAPEDDFKSCLLLNISACEPVQDVNTFVATLYNPRSHPVSTYVRIPVSGKAYVVKDYIGTEILAQLVPIPVPVSQIPGRSSQATRELVFRALEVPPLGSQSFHITEKEGDDIFDQVNEPEPVTQIGGDLYNISVDISGDISIQWKNSNLQVRQSFHYYEGAKGNNSVFENRASGAYIFRPKDSNIHNFNYLGSHKFYKGPLVEELHFTLNSYVSQVVRVYNGEDKIEFDWLVGPIPVHDGIGKEIVTRYSSNLASDGVFFTDSNGREMLKRVRDFRPTWNLNLSEPIAGNYYPVTAKISLKDDAKGFRLSVLNDRAQGGTSMTDGELEVMIHRRLLNDDAFGVGEALNETAFGTGLVARGTHYLVGSSLKDLDAAASKEKSLQLSLALKPWVFITPAQRTFDEWRSNYRMQTKGLGKRLPQNVHILTLEPWKENEVLLRLEHLYEIGEASQLSQPTEVNLADLFAGFDLVSVRETTLGANQWIEEKNRLQWMSETNEIRRADENETRILNVKDGVINVLLKAMEIRTFIVHLKASTST